MSGLVEVLVQVREALASADREEVEPLLDALTQSLQALGTQGTTRALALWLEDGLREAVNTPHVSSSPARGLQVSQTVASIQQILVVGGLDAVDDTLRLALWGAVKGNSRSELDNVFERFHRGLVSNAFVSLDPHNKRHPVEVLSTGSLGLTERLVVSSRGR